MNGAFPHRSEPEPDAGLISGTHRENRNGMGGGTVVRRLTLSAFILTKPLRLPQF